MKISKLFNDFFDSEKSGGLILILCTVLSLVLANSPVGISYQHFFHIDFAGMSLEHWINEGLMTIFFLMIGLELEREVYAGELSRLKVAMLPVSAAIGGMLVPATIFLSLNMGTPHVSGAGIPMATDIAFSLGVLSMLGKRVPTSLKVFLTALAVIDDLGAILIIAFCYSGHLSLIPLFISLSFFGALLLLNRLKINKLIPYIIGGIGMWYFMMQSGVHATISGVLLAFAIPFGKGDENSISYKLQHALHKPVAFLIIPLFALCNTAIQLDLHAENIFRSTYVWGIFLGLALGKPIGVFFFSVAAQKLRLCTIPADLSTKSILGAGILAGIGFTMSIFITLLAFSDQATINQAKLVIIITSLITGIAGYLFLARFLPPPSNDISRSLSEFNQAKLKQT